MAMDMQTFMKAIREGGSVYRQELLDAVESSPLDPVTLEGSIGATPIPSTRTSSSDLFVPTSLPALPSARASTGSGPTLGNTSGTPSNVLPALQGQQVTLPSLALLLQQSRS